MSFSSVATICASIKNRLSSRTDQSQSESSSGQLRIEECSAFNLPVTLGGGKYAERASDGLIREYDDDCYGGGERDGSDGDKKGLK
jgi:hypothetical protein